MTTGPLERVTFRSVGAVLGFTVDGVLRGVVVGGAAGLAFAALFLTVDELTSSDTGSFPGGSAQLFFTVAASLVVLTFIGAVLGAAVGLVIALAGYDRPRWLPAIGGVVASCGWLAWDWRLYSRSGGLELSNWIGLFLLVLPFAAVAGVLHGIWLRKLRRGTLSRVTSSSTD